MRLSLWADVRYHLATNGSNFSMNLNSTSARGAIYGITAAAIWGGMYVVSDVVLHVIPPFALLSLRLIIGAVILGVFLTVRRQIRLPRRDAIKLLAVVIFGFGISLAAQFV